MHRHLHRMALSVLVLVEEAPAPKKQRSSMITRNSTDESYVECMSPPAAHKASCGSRGIPIPG
ncbi:hypothetical protein MUK42_33600 [Musa troglodytarum]|uniref:Uncharacterized protein n=1 Tax=Musa troglodytarum TaxID=320322 RepID=A0A9E7FD32_9LILI|nr:hypothetical protein MUK42_33600 [Musa troglodytarum]